MFLFVSHTSHVLSDLPADIRDVFLRHVIPDIWLFIERNPYHLIRQYHANEIIMSKPQTSPLRQFRGIS